MYGTQPGVGAGSLVGSAALLPNTGGSTILTVIAITGMVVGSAILLTSVARVIAQKVSK